VIRKCFTEELLNDLGVDALLFLGSQDKHLGDILEQSVRRVDRNIKALL